MCVPARDDVPTHREREMGHHRTHTRHTFAKKKYTLSNPCSMLGKRTSAPRGASMLNQAGPSLAVTF
jgi:hypothetical protein